MGTYTQGGLDTTELDAHPTQTTATPAPPPRPPADLAEAAGLAGDAWNNAKVKREGVKAQPKDLTLQERRKRAARVAIAKDETKQPT